MDADLDRLARRQHSLLTCSQLRAAGWTKDAIFWAVRTGDLITVRRGVYRTAGGLPTADMARMAAVLATGGGAFLANLSTLNAYGLRYFPPSEVIHVISVGRHVQQPGVVGHRTIWLPEHARTRLRFIPTTTAERAFIDCCGVISASDLGRAGDDALRRKLLSLPKLVQTFDHTPVPGRRKAAPMWKFLAKRVKGFDPGGSDGELNVRLIIEQAGLPLPVQQFRVVVEGHRYVIDHAYPDTLHALEFEGYWAHGKLWTPFHYDRERTRRLQRAGWTVWPLTSETTANEIIAIATLATDPFAG